MRTLLASVSAIAVVLWTAYAGLQRLPEPREPAISERPIGTLNSTTTGAAGRSDLPGRTEQVETEHEPRTSGEVKTSDGPALSASSNEPTSGAPPAIKDDPQASMKAEDAAPESCTPIGITVSGKLVFPMRCQELLARNRGPDDVEGSSPESSSPPPLAPKEDQKAESPKSLAEASVTQQPTEPSLSDANAKLEDRPQPGAAKPGKARAEADVEPARKAEKRHLQDAKRNGAMLIVRTIFPRWSP